MQKMIQENESLLFELHRTQEDLEARHREIESLKNLLSAKSKIVERMLSAYPDYVNARDVSINSHKSIFTPSGLDFSIDEITISHTDIESLNFTVDTSNDSTKVFFPRSVNGSKVNDWISWQTIPHHVKAIIMSEGVPNLPSRGNSVGKHLTASEWHIVSQLPRLASNLIQKQKTSLSASPNLKKIALESLYRFQKCIDKWPTMLRCDLCELKHVVVKREYKSIELHLANVIVGEKSLGNIEFTISTVDADENHFGSHPRLEFYEKSRSTFEHWFQESSDERGSRLELRFAGSDEMDMAVWHQLVDNDKILVTALISSLPSLIESLKTTNSHFKSHRAQWLNLTQNMKNILKSRLL